MIVVGGDIGPSNTAVVSIEIGLAGTEILDHVTLNHPRRPTGADLLYVDPDYLDEVIATMRTEVVLNKADLLAVEGLKKPKGRRRGAASGETHIMDPTPTIGTGIVLGAVLSHRSAFGVPLVVVPPGGNGRQDLAMYPEVLRPSRGKGKGHDALQHARSAYDVARQGPQCARYARALGGVYTTG